MKEFNVQQGTPEWDELRCGVPTASQFGELMTTKFELRDGATYKTFLYKKVAEALTGPLPSFGSRATDQGHFLEPEAVPYFEMETGLDVRTVGFVLADGGKCGCSPDGLIGTEGAVVAGVEIKCPGPAKQVQYLAEGKLPTDYLAQVYGSMFVTGCKEWRFLAYHRRLPKLLLTVKRDEAIMEKIADCIDEFTADFEALIDRIKPAKLQAA